MSEIRRDIIKQLGINFTHGRRERPQQRSNLTNPFSINGATAIESRRSAGQSATATLAATLQAYEQQGVASTLAEPTVTAISGESAKFLAGGTIPIPGGETCPAASAARHHPATLWRQPQLHAGRAVARAASSCASPPK